MIKGLTIFPIQTDLAVWLQDSRLANSSSFLTGTSSGAGALYVASTGDPVTGSSFAMSYVTSTNGQFYGVMPDLALTDGTSYYLEVVLTAADLTKITYRHTAAAGYMGDDA